MAYVSMTLEDLEARISDAEREALDSAGQGAGYRPRLPGILDQVTRLVRAKVATFRSNILAPQGIPQECLYHAVTLARHALIASLPLADGYVDPRKAEYEAAVAFFDQVASGAVTVAAPDGSPVNATGLQWGGEKRLCF